MKVTSVLLTSTWKPEEILVFTERQQVFRLFLFFPCDWSFTHASINFHLIHRLSCTQACRRLEPLPANWGRKWSTHKPPVYRSQHGEMLTLIHLHLTVGGSRSTRRDPTETQGEHTNSTQNGSQPHLLAVMACYYTTQLKPLQYSVLCYHAHKYWRRTHCAWQHKATGEGGGWSVFKLKRIGQSSQHNLYCKLCLYSAQRCVCVCVYCCVCLTLMRQGTPLLPRSFQFEGHLFALSGLWQAERGMPLLYLILII